MAPKTKTTKEDIIEAAFSLVRECGIESFSARELAKRLKTSTQPIFSNFKDMDEVKEKVIESALSLYYEKLAIAEQNEIEKKMKARGLAYICFARKESNLFKLLFMSERGDKSFPIEESRRELDLIKSKTHLDDSNALLMEKTLFLIVHGIAVNIVTNTVVLSNEEIDRILDVSYPALREALKNGA